VPELNLFMICMKLDRGALSELSSEYHIRNCRKDELDIWKAMPFDDALQAEQYRSLMSRYYEEVYAPKGDLFFRSCLFVCNTHDVPIATGFVWKAYDEFSTIHWLKVVRSYEGRGIGRALLSIMMTNLSESDYPVFLHTQPSSYRAIKLYSDFGFALLTDPVIGKRKNDIQRSLPVLESCMPSKSFGRLRTCRAPEYFVRRLENEGWPQF
jgi:ribosomal protein S18 acetylase RimI-like enzyme